MTKPTHVIERLIPPVGDSDLRALARLLVDVVESGAAVSFLAPLTLERAEGWWRRAISASRSGAIFLVARDVEGIVVPAQLNPPWGRNRRHRGGLASLLLHGGSGRKALGTRLFKPMRAGPRRP